MSPMTAPLEKATRNAAERLVCAAAVVRTAAPVAVRMPTHPAVADNTAPTRKLTPTHRASPGRNVTRMMNMIATKSASHWYSVRKKAIAPLRISAEICCIFSVPASRRLMLRTNTMAKIAAKIGAPNPRNM